MLYSMDRWYINPYDPKIKNPKFHTKGLADLNIVPEDEFISREDIEEYLRKIEEKIKKYINTLTDEELVEIPEGCDISRFRLILGQFRHWHRHMGIIYGFIINDEKKWPYVLNMYGKYPSEPMPNYF